MKDSPEVPGGVTAVADRPAPPLVSRLPPAPLSGGPLGFWRFVKANQMIRSGYVPLLARWLWLKLRYRGRLETDGLCFIRPGVKFEIGSEAKVRLGRWSWIGDGCKIRAHEGVIEIGAKTVLGQECTLSCYQRISIGRECIFADRTMLIDFDHCTADVEETIRKQGIYKRDVKVGHNVWLGYGACVLRGSKVGDNAVVGANSVVTSDVPDDAVAGGVPARVLRMRDTPETFRWA